MTSTISSSLRRRRNQLRQTLITAGTAAGMSPQHFSEIESAKRDPRLSTIERMAEALGMTLMLVPSRLAPDIRRYINSGKTYSLAQQEDIDHDI